MARRTSTCVASLLPVFALMLASSADITGQDSTFRSGVEMVPLTVTVTDGAGNYVSGLSERDFAVFEDGVLQPLSFFASESVPVDVAFVVDTSSSMSADLPLVQEAAKGLVRALRDGDRGAVVSVNSLVDMPRRFTSDHASVAAAIDALRCSGATALYDGVYIVLKEFAREQRSNTDVRRQVLVLLSDGVDNVSHVSADEMAELAKRVGVNIYVIAIQRPTTVPSAIVRDPASQRAAFTMRTLAQDAGGRIFFPTMAAELPAIYRSIAQELASQYDLGYVPAKSGSDGKFRRVAVRVLPPTSAAARTRSGYYSTRVTGTPRYGTDGQPRSE